MPSPNIYRLIIVVVIVVIALLLFGLGPLEAAAFTFFCCSVLGYVGI